MFEAAVEALGVIFTFERMLWMLLGVAVGGLVGLLPGLGGTVGMSLLLPFIFGMDPFNAIALLIGMVSVVHTTDAYASVLLGVPGSSGSQATIMDGYPLARQGQGARALSISFFCSMVGGLVGAVVLFAVLFVARPLVLALGSPELFMLAILGISMVGVLGSRGSPLAGVLSAVAGLMLGTVGVATTVAEERYTFGSLYLYDGIPLAVLALGLFAIPEIVDLTSARESVSRAARLSGSYLQGIRDSVRHKWLVLRSAVLGTAIGIVPGLGGAVVDWITYGIARASSKDNERFGEGDVRGVIAPESSNNANMSGALIPTLLFGIPGNGATAVLLGGFVLLGIQTGPTMVTSGLPLTLAIIWTLVIANIFGTALCFGLSGWVAKLTLVPMSRLFPLLLLVFVVAAYQSSRSWGDLVALFFIGILGWVMKGLKWPRPPMLIGFVLATSIERYLHISVNRFGYDWLTRPTVIGIGVVTVLILAASVRLYSRSSTGQSRHAEGRGGNVG